MHKGIPTHCIPKGPFKNYVILLGGGGRSPKDFIRLQGGGGIHQKITLDYKGGQYGSTLTSTKYQRKPRFY